MNKKTYRVKTEKGYVVGFNSNNSPPCKFHNSNYKEWGSLWGAQELVSWIEGRFASDCMIQELLYAPDATNYPYKTAVDFVDDGFAIAYNIKTGKYFNTSKGFNTNLSGAKLYPSVKKLKESVEKYYKKLEEAQKPVALPAFLSAHIGTSHIVPACSSEETDISVLQDDWIVLKMIQYSSNLPGAMSSFDPKKVPSDEIFSKH